MTIEDVLATVENETGHKVTSDTDLKDLGMDSLDFLDLILKFPNITDPVVPRINTVNDLYLAAIGEL